MKTEAAESQLFLNQILTLEMVLKLFLDRLTNINIPVWVSMFQGFYEKISDFPHIDKIL